MSAQPATVTRYPAPEPKATTLQTLLQLHGQPFIENAYRLVLDRQADAEGVEYYLRRLMHGVSKIQILRQLLESDEGRAAGHRLPHLRTAIQLQRLAQLPLIGVLSKLLFSVDGDSASEMRLRAVEQHLFELKESTQYHIMDTHRTLARLMQVVGAPPPTVTPHIGVQLEVATTESPAPIAESAQSNQATQPAEVAKAPESFVARPIVLQGAGAQEILSRLAEQLSTTREAQQLSLRK